MSSTRLGPLGASSCASLVFSSGEESISASRQQRCTGIMLNDSSMLDRSNGWLWAFRESKSWLEVRQDVQNRSLCSGPQISVPREANARLSATVRFSALTNHTKALFRMRTTLVSCFYLSVRNREPLLHVLTDTQQPCASESGLRAFSYLLTTTIKIGRAHV